MQRRDFLRKQRRLLENQGEMIENKGNAINFGVMSELANMWLDDPMPVDETIRITADLKEEHALFANTKNPRELEEFSRQTVVGIGLYKKGRKQGYILVDNEAKSGLGFPGGRVRIGESTEPRLVKEFLEETGLHAVVASDSPVAEFKVGEEEHIFSAFEIQIAGGKPQVIYRKDEPIVGILLIDEVTLEALCKTGGVLPSGKGILPNHRKAFLQFLRRKRGE